MSRTPHPKRTSAGQTAGDESHRGAGDESHRGAGGQVADDMPMNADQLRIDVLLDEWEATYEAGCPLPPELDGEAPEFSASAAHCSA